MNEPAFPRPASPAHEYGFHKHQDGMTLRDYFAAKAMQTFLQTNSGVIGCNQYEYRIAEDAYDIADAMLKARAE